MGRDELYDALKAEKIDTRRYYYPPLHQQAIYASRPPSGLADLPHTEHIATVSLTLPMFAHMTEDQVEGVCDAIVRLHENGDAVTQRWSRIAEGESE